MYQIYCANCFLIVKRLVYDFVATLLAASRYREETGQKYTKRGQEVSHINTEYIQDCNCAGYGKEVVDL
jgi:hypothetical protein